MQFGMMDYSFGWMGIGMLILGLVFWILVIVGLVLLIKYLWEGGGAKRQTESALEFLKKRYARGEITKEEFEEKKKDIL